MSEPKTAREESLEKLLKECHTVIFNCWRWGCTDCGPEWPEEHGPDCLFKESHAIMGRIEAALKEPT